MSDSSDQTIDVNSLFSIAGKTALVTGGSQGIGLMIARGFVEAGARVYISSRKSEVCDQVAETLNGAVEGSQCNPGNQRGTCISLPADISSEEGWQGLAKETSEREPALHILINNAGATWGGELGEFPASGFDKIFDLNVKSTFMLTQSLLPLLEKAAHDANPA